MHDHGRASACEATGTGTRSTVTVLPTSTRCIVRARASSRWRPTWLTARGGSTTTSRCCSMRSDGTRSTGPRPRSRWRVCSARGWSARITPNGDGEVSRPTTVSPSSSGLRRPPNVGWTRSASGGRDERATQWKGSPGGGSRFCFRHRLRGGPPRGPWRTERRKIVKKLVISTALAGIVISGGVAWSFEKLCYLNVTQYGMVRA